MGVGVVLALCSYASTLIFLLIFLAGPCQWSVRLWSGFSDSALLETCPALWLHSFLALLLLLVWPSPDLTSGSAIVSSHPCVIMPLVWVFVFYWTALDSGVGGCLQVFLP